MEDITILRKNIGAVGVGLRRRLVESALVPLSLAQKQTRIRRRDSIGRFLVIVYCPSGFHVRRVDGAGNVVVVEDCRRLLLCDQIMGERAMFDLGWIEEDVTMRR